MKRFSIISMLMTLVIDAMACSGPAIMNYYVFSAYTSRDWSQRVNQLCNDNWRAYLGSTDDYYSFDANEVAEAARKKGDLLMVSYVEHLEQYLECAGACQLDVWDYPTKEELDERQQKLRAVAAYARQKVGSRLRSQHALLLMRCQMMLGQHQQNVSFWEQTASRFINSVYRDMMQNIYAGALLKTGRTDEATALFMEMGDTESLYTYYYKRRSCQTIEEEYQRNPSSPALSFLVQDFVNNAQEAIDAEDEYAYWPGKLFIRDIQKAERQQMCQLCTRVLSERKTREPALWLSAKAWLEYLGGNHRQALADITLAQQQEGTPRQRDNARAIGLFIKAATTASYDRQFDQQLAEGLQWLEEKAAEERKLLYYTDNTDNYANHYTQVYDRLTRQVLVPRYDAANRYDIATALLAAYDEQPKRASKHYEGLRLFKADDYNWNPDYSGDFFSRIDTLRVDRLESYLDYINSTPKTPLDQWLTARVRHADDFFADLAGTKYLRLGQWQQAARWLERVPLDFVNRQNITPYAVARSYSVEPWLKKQEVANDQPGAVAATTNKKLDYARQMLQLEQDYRLLKARQQYERAYQLAVSYYQASHLGQCWFITRYGQSCSDTLRTNEKDFVAQAIEYLQQAKQSADLRLRERSLYALAFMPTGAWRQEEWDEQASDFVVRTYPYSRQYKALADLADFATAHASELSPYVSRCDVLKQFRKQYKR